MEKIKSLIIREDAATFEKVLAQCSNKRRVLILRSVARFLCKRLEEVAKSMNDMSELMQRHHNLFLMLESVRKRLSGDDLTRFTQTTSSIFKSLHHKATSS